MPRAPRIEFAGAIYHVMNRGNHLEDIFRDEIDRGLFIKTLEETCQSSGWIVHSFVLMRNHYHLLIETQRPTLVKGMQYLNSTYTRRYNVRHKTFGHLFQGRYKALLVDIEERGYFLTVSDYIHMNPVRAKKVGTLQELLKDRWSSAGWLTGSFKEKKLEWLSWERVYGEFGIKNWKGKARREYQEYLGRRINELKDQSDGWKKIRRGWCFGGEDFIDQMKEKLEELAEKPRDRDNWNDPAAEEIEEIRAMKLLGKGMEVFGGKDRVKGKDRYLLSRWVRSRCKVSVKWLAEQLGVKTCGGMSHGIYLAGQLLKKDQRMIRKWRLLETIR